MQKPQIDLTDQQFNEVVKLLDRYLPNVEAWAYGSRAKCVSKKYSDLDLVVFSAPAQRKAVYELREAFDESSLPFRVDLFIWDEIPESFKKNIVAEKVVLKR